jgi:hypothetical protein
MCFCGKIILLKTADLIWKYVLKSRIGMVNKLEGWVEYMMHVYFFTLPTQKIEK